MVKSGLIPLVARTTIAALLLLGILELATVLAGRAFGGNIIAFLGGHDGIYRIYLLDENRLAYMKAEHTSITHFVISPDGQKIAFENNFPGQKGPEFYIMDTYGSHFRQRTQTRYAGEPLAWSPDNTQLVFLDEDPSEGEDGKDPDDVIFLLDVDSGTKRQLTHHPIPYYSRNVAWSPDEQQIALFSNSDSLQVSQIFIVPINGGKEHLLTSISPLKPGTVADLAWSPDGQSIEFSEVTAGFSNSSVYTIYRIDTDGKNLRTLSEGATYSIYSPPSLDSEVPRPVIDRSMRIIGPVQRSSDNQWIAYEAELPPPLKNPLEYVAIVTSRVDGSDKHIFIGDFQYNASPVFMPR